MVLQRGVGDGLGGLPRSPPEETVSTSAYGTASGAAVGDRCPIWRMPRGGCTRAAASALLCGQACSMLPPAASTFSLAEPETASTTRESLTLTSPVPSTLTGCPERTAPLATRSATVTSPPSGYRAAS